MATAFTVKLPDGNEYGPVDLATLRSWHDEGRIGPDTWVWPEGSPEWLTLIDVLAGAGQEPQEPEAPLRFKEEPKPRPTPEPVASPVASPAARPAARRPRPGPAVPAPRAGVPWLAVGGVLLLALMGALSYFVLLPRLDRARGERTIGESLPDRRYADDSVGVTVDLPEGWVLLKPESALFTAPQASARFAHPATGAVAALTVQSVPPGVLSLDAFIDRVVDLRRALLSDYRETGRIDVPVSGRPARRLLAGWKEGGSDQMATVVALQDAWSYAALAVWGPARSKDALSTPVEELLKGLRRSGVLEGRVQAAATTLQPEVPELSAASLALIVSDRLGSGGALDEVVDTAVFKVSQGLPALSPQEAEEMRQVYAQVYEPMPEEQRRRLAAWQREVRAGRKAGPEAQDLRPLLRDALLALPEEARARLQAISEKAISAAYSSR